MYTYNTTYQIQYINKFHDKHKISINHALKYETYQCSERNVKHFGKKTVNNKGNVSGAFFTETHVI